MNNQTKKFLIIDGNSLAYRAFYALPFLSNRVGVTTNAAYGFTTMLFKILEEEKPECVACCFDKGRATFRHSQFAEYKATRKETPDELRPQFGLIKQILEAMRIPYFELEKYEADDLIGTLVTQGEAHGYQNLILTGDRDALQLVSPHTHCLITRKGISEIDVYDLDRVRQVYALEPPQLIDVKALTGDVSDNIPGVPGIGEKTALHLIQTYGSLDAVLRHLALVPARVRTALERYRDLAYMSRGLATIACDVPITIDWEACRYEGPDYARLLEVFRQLEFRSLVKAVLKKMEAGAADSAGHDADHGGDHGGDETPMAEPDGEPVPVRTEAEGRLDRIADGDGLKRWLWQALKGERNLGLSLIWEGSGYRRARILGLGLTSHLGSIGVDAGDLPNLPQVLREVFEVLKPARLYVHDAKAHEVCLAQAGVGEVKMSGDTMLAAYLLDPAQSEYSLSQLVLEHLDEALAEPQQPWEQAGLRSRYIFRLHEVLQQKLRLADMEQLYQEVELPLTWVLGRMEMEGVRVDPQRLKAMGEGLAADLEALSQQIYELAGTQFNINSPKQLGQVLFEKLKLPVGKRTKTGYSTSIEVLEELAQEHEIAARIIEYRQLAKLKSTYVEGLYPLIDPETGKLHTTFNQAVTATGRLSSTEPNLQNIPVRLEVGRRIRQVFVPRAPDWVILAADYSQIELRVLAHISGDENLRAAFFEGQDIHTRTASEVFGVPFAEVTPEMRRRAKAVNFGIVYGISDFGLARDLGIPREEAKEYIDRYFARYPRVLEYIQEIIARAKEVGYVTTLLNRRRYLTDLYSANRAVRNFGERTAMNTPIQGSAADIIKLAMLRVDRLLREKQLEAAMILQVHDELIFDVPKDELKVVARLAREAMEGAVKLEVPLKVELKYGPNWYQLEELADEDLE